MKKVILFFSLMIGLSVSAQDIIKLKKGEELKVKVLKVTPSYVEYSYPSEDAVIQIQRWKVASIHYESGRVEEFVPIKLPKTKEKPVKEPKETKPFVNPLSKKQMFYVKAGLALNKIHFYDGFLNPGFRFKTGEVLDLGYSRYIKNSKFYWAAELGLTTRSVRTEIYIVDMDDMVFTCPFIVHHGIKASPVIFGYRFILPRDFAIDLRLGGYFAYYYAGKMLGGYDYTEENGFNYYTWNASTDDEEHYSPYFKMQRRYNAGFETGIAFWYKRFCFDFTYNTGFVSYERVPIQPVGMKDIDYYDALWDNPESLDWKVNHKNYNYNIQFKLGIAF